MKYVVVIVILLGWFFSIGILALKAKKDAPAPSLHNPHIGHGSKGKPSAAVVPQRSAGVNNPVIAQYRETLSGDLNDVKTALEVQDASLASRQARQLLCTLSGFENWRREHGQQKNPLYTPQAVLPLVQRIINATRLPDQQSAFQKLSRLLDSTKTNAGS